MCDTNWTDRRRELESLEKSWKEFEDFARWMKRRWSKRPTPDPASPQPESPVKPQPVTS
jgi:hypothetical protein